MNFKHLVKSIVFSILCSIATVGHAYKISDPWHEWSRTSEDLSFPTKATEYGWSKYIENNLFSPTNSSDTPMPAIILIHACNGITNKSAPDLRFWIKTMTDKGFYVLSIDQFAKGRGITNCKRPRDVHPARLVKDIFDATEHLSKLEFIDKNRIFTLGFSMGTMAGQLASSRSVYEKIAPGKPRPRAISGLYGGCQYRIPPSGNWAKWLFEDSNTPLMLLMGEKDVESPAEDCVLLIQEIQKKIPQTQYHIYENATHCYDCQNMSGFSKTALNGKYVRYEYNKEATEDSVRRLVDFFNSFK